MLIREIGAYSSAIALASSDAHGRAVASVAAAFIAFAGAQGPWRADPSTVALAYLSALLGAGRTRKTILNHRSAVAGFLRYLAGVGMLGIAACPCPAMRKPDEPVARYLREDEVARVLEMAETLGIAPEIGLALATGLRLGELIRLRWDDVDEARRVLLVRRAKGHRPRVIPLNADALPALVAQRAKLVAADAIGIAYVFPARQTWRGDWRFVDKPRHCNWWRRAMRPIQAAVPRFTTDAPGCRTGRAWHLLRHTFASRLAQAGVSLYKIAQWLGHRDVRTTQIYAHLQQGYDPDIERRPGAAT